MPKKKETKNQYAETMYAAIPKLKVLGFDDFKSNLPEHPDPKPLSKAKTKGFQFIPDMVADRRGRKAYLEISKKSDDMNRLISKWTSLDKMAANKNGFFGIIVPKGMMKFTQKLIQSRNIGATLIRI